MGVINPKDFDSLSPLFRRLRGHRQARYVLRKVALDEINLVYDSSGTLPVYYIPKMRAS